MAKFWKEYGIDFNVILEHKLQNRVTSVDLVGGLRRSGRPEDRCHVRAQFAVAAVRVSKVFCGVLD